MVRDKQAGVEGTGNGSEGRSGISVGFMVGMAGAMPGMRRERSSSGSYFVCDCKVNTGRACLEDKTR